MRKQPAARAVLAVSLLFFASCASPALDPEEHDASFYNNNAQHYYDGGQYERALSQFDKAIESEPDNFTARLGRAWSLLMVGEGQIRQRRAEGAENIQLAMEDLLSLEPDAPAEQSFKVNLGLGQAHARMGDLYDNRAQLIKAQSEMRPVGGPEVEAALNARTQASEHRRQAELLFNSVLKTKDNPAAQGSLTALIELARLSVIKRRYEDAYVYGSRYLEQVSRSKELWSELIRRFPADRPMWEARLAGAVIKEVEARDLMANILFKMGRFDEAEDELQRVIWLDPNRGDAYLNRAIIYEELGRKADAVLDLKAFIVRAAEIEMDPGDPRAIEATRRLMRLEKELGMEPTIRTTSQDSDGGGM